MQIGGEGKDELDIHISFLLPNAASCSYFLSAPVTVTVSAPAPAPAPTPVSAPVLSLSLHLLLSLSLSLHLLLLLLLPCSYFCICSCYCHCPIWPKIIKKSIISPYIARRAKKRSPPQEQEVGQHSLTKTKILRLLI